MLSSLGLEQLFSMPKAAGMRLLLRIRNSPNALALEARGLLTMTRCAEPALSIEDLGGLSSDQRNKSEAGQVEQLPKAK
jgi:hypothetical protein